MCAVPNMAVFCSSLTSLLIIIIIIIIIGDGGRTVGCDNSNRACSGVMLCA